MTVLSRKGADVARSSLSARLSLTIFVVALCDLAATTCWAQSTAEILSRLDRAAQSFVGATAGIRVTTHTGVIDEDETQAGTFAVKRSSPDEIQFLINFTGQDAQAIALRGRTLQIYYPKLNTIREYDVGKYKDPAQKLILLGFGMPGRELAANYDVSNLGAERVQSEDSVHLQLTPKAPEVLRELRRVDLWISLKTNCPVQQKFYPPGGDYRLAAYSDIKINPRCPPLHSTSRRRRNGSA
jgi:outer membrane lipoprotein-sorting protein